MAQFDESQIESMIRSSISDLTDNYDDDYWRDIRDTDDFPQEFWDELADNNWIGANIPEEYGGAGLGIQEICYLIEGITKGGAWPIATEFVITPTFGGETLVAHGSEAQKERYLPKIANGDARWALGVTEPDAGLNTTNISTTAEKDGDEYVINGQKMWISNVSTAERITLLVRTTPKSEVDSPTEGLSIILVDPDLPGVDYDPIELDTYYPDETYALYLDGVRVHESELVGEEDNGLYQLFDTLNSERITAAAAAIGMGYHAIDQASEYANQREVFSVPIGSHQSIQHLLADTYADLKCTELLTHKAAWQYDEGTDAGEAANISNLKGTEAAWNACEAAMTTYGGMSISADLGLASMWSLVRHMRTAPVSEQMLRNFIGESVLGLPKSY
jgi:acyl-CoA dehydrogenase